jgi:eukaryotic-like serine/threonine-protein kinase
MTQAILVGINRYSLSIIIAFLIIYSVLNITSCSNSESEMVLIKGGPTGDFYIGKYEVTNKEFCQFKPDHKGKWSNSDYPVESVSWDKAVKYCQWLSKQTGKNYRLPTEAEWEYACRAGSKTDYYWGEEMNQYTNDNPNLCKYAWYYKNSNLQPHPVGQMQPNTWGLYDMLGNVSELCDDWSDKSKTRRVDCGGNWGSVPKNCRSSSHGNSDPFTPFDDLGFRVVRQP